MFIIEIIEFQKNFRMLPNHRKILPLLPLKTTKASKILEGGKAFQIDQSPSKLGTVAVVVPASAGWVLIVKVPQKSDRNSTELQSFYKMIFSRLTNYLNTCFFLSHDTSPR